MNINFQKIINKKWTLPILFILQGNKQLSYKKIKTILNIPNSTVSLRLNDLVECKYIEKFIYGSISKPHYTEYQITKFGLDYLNNLTANHKQWNYV